MGEPRTGADQHRYELRLGPGELGATFGGREWARIGQRAHAEPRCHRRLARPASAVRRIRADLPPYDVHWRDDTEHVRWLSKRYRHRTADLAVQQHTGAVPAVPRR